MKAVSDSLHNFGSSLLRFPLTIITSIIVTRMLGPEDKGLYVYLILIGGVLLPILSLGIGNGIQYYLSNRKYSLVESAISTICLGLVTGLFLSLFVFGLWNFGLFGQSGNEAPFFVLVCFLAGYPLDGCIYTIKFLLLGDSKFKESNYISLLNGVLSSILLLFFVVTGEQKLLSAAVAINLVKVATLCHSLYFVAKETPSFAFDWGYVKDIYNYGLKTWLGTISARANDQLDQLIVGMFIGPASLGVYSVAYAVVNLLLLPSNAISPILFNEISRVKDFQKSAVMAAQVHRALLFVVSSIAIVLAIVSYWLIPVFYGEEFKGAYIPMLILLPGIILYSVSRRVLQKILAANGFPLQTSLIQVVSSIVGVVSYLILIPKFDIIGAAIGSTIAYGASMVVAYLLVVSKSIENFGFFRFSMKDVKWLILRIRRIPIKKSLL